MAKLLVTTTSYIGTSGQLHTTSLYVSSYELAKKEADKINRQDLKGRPYRQFAIAIEDGSRFEPREEGIPVRRIRTNGRQTQGGL